MKSESCERALKLLMSGCLIEMPLSRTCEKIETNGGNKQRLYWLISVPLPLLQHFLLWKIPHLHLAALGGLGVDEREDPPVSAVLHVLKEEP